MKSTIEEALELRKENKLAESNALLLTLYGENSEDAYFNYQIAWSFDVLENEAEAIAYYEKAIHLGLTSPDLEEAFLGLASTYRALGKYEKSREILVAALSQFPQHNALKVFYSMSLFNLKEYDEAFEILLNLLAQTSADSKINDYSKAITFYADKMHRVWE